MHRVIAPVGVLPQAAQLLDTRRELWPDETRVRVERLNLDAASFRQLEAAHDGNGDAVRAAVLDIVRTRGKMQNPVTGSGGMLIGVVEEVGPEASLGLAVGDRVATLVSLSLTPLVVTDGLARWDGRGEQVPCDGYAVLFGRSIAARLPDDLAPALALMVMDVCGAPALTARVVGQYVGAGVSTSSTDGVSTSSTDGVSTSSTNGVSTSSTDGVSTDVVVAVVGGAGKSGSLALAAAKDAGAGVTVGVVPHQGEADLLTDAGVADHVVVADARDPVALRDAVASAAPGGAHVTVVCVDVPGCEGGALLTTREGGTVVFFSMATSFSAAALGAEGLAADVTMLVGNGYVPGHADLALDVLRRHDGVRKLFERRLDGGG
ncbi:L-erythro-3,5-diaminohexanoate dehydrogenase [Nocardioides sp. HDW12B]|uniref:L-erythro-3,5-diaminohexanoate dehydrogenase n=1 Tax=Nocardioides sp. HDW12B TaxID=2714939 RepID=UPI00197F9E6F|nr:L-erythro-3,5-diaminohexanoate dehydrogenase [Nocardioides sp. HDW12B]